MQDLGLINFTRTSLDNGKTDSEIIEVLRKNGQSEDQIRLIFEAAAGIVSTSTKVVSENVQDVNLYDASFNPLKERYAGFGIRFVAGLIDSIPFLLLKPLFPVFGLAILYCLYNIIMLELYSSTIGKMVVGIKVISEKGEPLTRSQILLRETLGKILSQFFYIGYIMIAFTRYKQGLHDKIAETYVVYRKE